MHHFASNLKFLRRQMGLSQEQLAAGIGLNRGNIASYEKKSAEPSMANLSKIGKFFNVDLGELIDKDLSERQVLMNNIGKASTNDNIQGEEVAEILLESLEDNQLKIEKFRQRSDEMARILDGFRQFHKFRMENGDKLSDDVMKMALDYEKLLDVLAEVLTTNKHMMKLLDDKYRQ